MYVRVCTALSNLSCIDKRICARNSFFFFFFFFFFFAALTDLTLASKRPMNSMGPTGAQKSAPGPIFQDRHSGNIVINVGRGGGALPKIDCHRSRV